MTELHSQLAALAGRLDKMLATYADEMPKQAYFEVDAVMRALAAQSAQAAAVPAGWVLVPREPTDAMIAPWLTEEQLAGGKSGGDLSPHAAVLRKYYIMLSAAPAPAAVKDSLTGAQPDRSQVSDTTSALIEMLIQRDATGRAKYGKTLDRTDLTHEEWLRHMAEEMLDGAGYALAALRTAQPKPAEGGAVVAWQAAYPDGSLYGDPVRDAPPRLVEYNAQNGHPLRPLVFGDVAPAGSGEE